MNKIKELFSGVLGIAMSIMIFVMIAFLIVFGARIVSVVYPPLAIISGIFFLICIFILLPLSFFKKTRIISIYGFYISSFVFGITLWVYSFLFTYIYWGIFGIILGIFIFGIGVIPFGFIASLLNTDWASVGNIVIYLIFALGTRWIAIRLATKLDKERVFKETLEPVEAENPTQITSATLDENQELDNLVESAITVLDNYDQASASLLQLKMGIPYEIAEKLIKELENMGAISGSKGREPRKVLFHDTGFDPLLSEAIKICQEYDNVSRSLFQRKLLIDYVRATKIFSQLKQLKIIKNEQSEFSEFGEIHIGIIDKNILEDTLKRMHEVKEEKVLQDNLSEESSKRKSDYNLELQGTLIQQTLEAFGIITKLNEINSKKNGVEYAFEVAVGSSIDKLSSLEKDIALVVASPTGKVKIQAPIPGKSLIGIFVPNKKS